MGLVEARQHRRARRQVLVARRCRTARLWYTTAAIGDLAGGTNGYINTWMVIGLTSHFYIRKYRAGWFRKYNVCLLVL